MKISSILIASAAFAAIAIPATAADLRVSRDPAAIVRISLAGKTNDQLNTEIRSAAESVCASAAGACVEASIADANRQVARINRLRQNLSQPGKVEVARQDPTTVRVKVSGRPITLVHADIDAAARKVCRAAQGTLAEYRGCVDEAVRSARARLGDLAQAPRSADRAAS